MLNQIVLNNSFKPQTIIIMNKHERYCNALNNSIPDALWADVPLKIQRNLGGLSEFVKRQSGVNLGEQYMYACNYTPTEWLEVFTLERLAEEDSCINAVIPYTILNSTYSQLHTHSKYTTLMQKKLHLAKVKDELRKAKGLVHYAIRELVLSGSFTSSNVNPQVELFNINKEYLEVKDEVNALEKEWRFILRAGLYSTLNTQCELYYKLVRLTK